MWAWCHFSLLSGCMQHLQGPCCVPVILLATHTIACCQGLLLYKSGPQQAHLTPLPFFAVSRAGSLLMRCCSSGTPSCCWMASLRPATLAWSSICGHSQGSSAP